MGVLQSGTVQAFCNAFERRHTSALIALTHSARNRLIRLWKLILCPPSLPRTRTYIPRGASVLSQWFVTDVTERVHQVQPPVPSPSTSVAFFGDGTLGTQRFRSKTNQPAPATPPPRMSEVVQTPPSPSTSLPAATAPHCKALTVHRPPAIIIPTPTHFSALLLEEALCDCVAAVCALLAWSEGNAKFRSSTSVGVARTACRRRSDGADHWGD